MPTKDTSPLSSEELIRAAYRQILGREPENDTVVHEQSKSLVTPDDVLRSFLHSAEYIATNSAFVKALAAGTRGRSKRIEVNATDELLKQLFSRIRHQWQSLGQSEPYWSVLTDDRFRQDKIEEFREEFNQSGSR